MSEREFMPGEPVWIVEQDGERLRAVVLDADPVDRRFGNVVGPPAVAMVAVSGNRLYVRPDALEPRKPDIPRERVEDLRRSIVTRMDQLDENWSLLAAFPQAQALRVELSAIATSLRRILEGGES